MSDTSTRTSPPDSPTDTVVDPRRPAGLAARLAAVRRPARAGRLALDYAILATLVLVIVVAEMVYPDFATSANLLNLLAQSAPVGIVAVGMTMVMVAGGFDLSVGALYAAGATVYAGLAPRTGLLVAALAAIGVGLAAGSLNGLAVTRLRINPFVATLGSASVFSGLVYLYSGSQPFIVTDPAFTALGRDTWFGIPLSVWLLTGVLLVGGLVLGRTVYGRSLYIVGGNAEAARLAGLRVNLLRGSTYLVVGGCSALAGMVIASRLSVGQADVGGTVALDAIAVVVIGGTSLFGGEGAVWRTFVGLLILAVLTNVFDSLAVDSNIQSITKGLIVIAAVSIDALARRNST